MSISRLLQRLKLRHKVAALGVVSMALLALPLVQLLRYQGLEVDWAVAERDRVEPALLAVDLQRGLVDHRLASRRVLSGQRQAETDRREHQAAVDARLALLGHRLEQGAHPPAMLELRDMRLDWPTLVQQVVARRFSVPESEHAHSLLIEQTLQIIDSVSAAGPAPQDARLAALLGPLPHALAHILTPTSQTMTPTLPGRPAADPASTAQAQALSTTIARLQDAVQRSQARRIAGHQGLRALAGAGLLTLVLGMVATLAWLRRILAAAADSATGTATSAGLSTNLSANPSTPLSTPRSTPISTAITTPINTPISTAISTANKVGPPAWPPALQPQPPPADGQQAERLARQGLMQRLRGPQPQAARPPPGESTQPQDL